MDYCLVPQESLSCFSNFRVTSAHDLYNNSSPIGVNDPGSSIPEHSLIRWDISCDSVYLPDLPQDAEWKTTQQYFDVSCVPSNFFTGPDIDEFIASLPAMIDILSTDNIYTKCIVSLEDEMKTKLPHSHRSYGGCNSKHRRYKPFWSDTLTELWKSYTDKLNLWKTSKATDKAELRNQWITARKVFDKALLAAKRNYWLSMQQELIQLQTRNP